MERRILYYPELGLEIEPVIEVQKTNTGSSFIYPTPKDFFKKIVKENLKDFYKDDLNERKAINACITLYHLVDWCCSSKSERKTIYEEMPYSNALESVVNGTKHFNQEKPYKAGIVEGTHIQSELILYNGKETLKLKYILRDIEKYWDNKLAKVRDIRGNL